MTTIRRTRLGPAHLDEKAAALDGIHEDGPRLDVGFRSPALVGEGGALVCGESDDCGGGFVGTS